MTGCRVPLTAVHLRNAPSPGGRVHTETAPHYQVAYLPINQYGRREVSLLLAATSHFLIHAPVRETSFDDECVNLAAENGIAIRVRLAISGQRRPDIPQASTFYQGRGGSK